MKADIEDLLRDGLDRLTADADLPPELATRAMRGHHRRQLRLRASALAGTALVTAAAAAIAVGSAAGGVPNSENHASGPSQPTVRYQTVAYVEQHIERALAGLRGRIMFFSRHAKPGSFGGTAPVIHSWTYRNVTKTQRNGPGVVTTERTVQRGKSTRVLMVDYRAKTWSRDSYYSAPMTYARNVCVGPADDEPGYNSPLWTQFVSSSLACGGFKIEGHATVGGNTEFKLVGTAKDVDAKFVPQILWVSARTYLPVRIVYPWGSDQISWLPATSANRALL